MDALRGYGEVMVKTADGMTVSLAQTLTRMAPKPAMSRAVQLITTGQCTNLPLIMDEFCTMSKTNGSEQWLRRLDNVIKLHMAKLQLGDSRLERIEEGVAVLCFDGASVKMTLVPIFETSSYAWHILDVNPGDFVQSESSRTALLIQFQGRFNRRPTQELLDLPIRLEKDLNRLKLLYRFNRLQEDFALMRESLYPNLEIQLTGPSTFKVVPWKHMGKSSPFLTLSANVEDCVLSVESSIRCTQEFTALAAEEILEILVAEHGRGKLQHLYDRLQESAPIALPLFESGQIRVEHTSLLVQMSRDQIEIYMQTFSGAMIARNCVELTKLLSSNKIEPIVKYLKARRMKDLFRILSSNCAFPIFFCDPSTVSIPQLSPNYLVITMANFVGKMIAVDLGQWPGTFKEFLISEDPAMSGRLVVRPLPGFQLPSVSLQNPTDILRVLSENVELYCSLVIEHELAMRGITFEEVSRHSWALHSIGALPSVTDIFLHMHLESVEFCLHFRGIVPINPEYTQTTDWYTKPLTIKSSGERVDFNSIFRRLHGFLALMAVSKQLEVRQVKHEFFVDGHVHFGHAQLGKISISINDKDNWDGFPLEMSFGRQELLHPDQVDGLQMQIRQSLSIGPIVEYLSRAPH